MVERGQLGMFNSETLLGWWVVVASLDLFMPAFVCVIVGNIMWLLLGTVSLAFWKSLSFFFLLLGSQHGYGFAVKSEKKAL